jgi:hypothetical protein
MPMVDNRGGPAIAHWAAPEVERRSARTWQPRPRVVGHRVVLAKQDAGSEAFGHPRRATVEG